MQKNTVKILDATIGAPAAPFYQKVCIPGAQFLEIATLCEPSYKPNWWPTEKTVKTRAEKLGLNLDDEIVVYEQPTRLGAYRAQYVLERFGFKNTKILDGGLAKWFAFYHPIDSGATSPKPTPSVLPDLKCDMSSLVDYDFVKKNIGNPDVQFVDA